MPIFPIDIVRQFLNAMEARDIVKAKEMLAHDFEMTFPGGAVFHELEQLILPKANEAEAVVVEGIRRVPVSTLSEVVQYLKGDLQITPKYSTAVSTSN